MTRSSAPLSDDWLTRARADLARLKPSPAQDAELLRRLTALQARHHPPLHPLATATTSESEQEPRWLRRLAWGSGLLGATAALLLSLMLVVDPPGSTGPVLAGSGFIPVVPEQELRAALAVERQAAVWLQPAEVPRERLALLGLPFDAARADEPVRAELMLNTSGQVLAVRVLP